MSECCWPVRLKGIFMPCDKPASKTFEDSGKFYCDKHFEMVKENREWLIEKVLGAKP